MQAGWYPDPTGDHEFRYHNGGNWTGDVATDGVRLATPVPDLSSPRLPLRRDPRSGTVPMVFGIASMSIGWVPFVCFVAVFFGAIGVVVGVKRRRFESARDASTVGIVTGAVGILLSAVGIWLSIVFVGTFADFEDPGPHSAELTECAEVAEMTRASGEITNLDDRQRSYTILVALDEDTTVEALVNDVPAGERRVFIVEENLRFAELDCTIVEVTGPRPFWLQQ